MHFVKSAFFLHFPEDLPFIVGDVRLIGKIAGASGTCREESCGFLKIADSKGSFYLLYQHLVTLLMLLCAVSILSSEEGKSTGC